MPLTTEQLAERVTAQGRPMRANTITKIEKMQRRVDVDDLVALAVALEARPDALLLPPTIAEDELQLTDGTVVTAYLAWRWMNGGGSPDRPPRGGRRHRVQPLPGTRTTVWPARLLRRVSGSDGSQVPAHRGEPVASIQKRPNGKWRARYRDEAGKEHARHFTKKVDAQRWLDEVSASVLTGQYGDPRAGRVTFRAYAEQWRQAKPHRPTTQVKAEQHLRVHAYPAFGDRPLARIRRSDVQSWVTGLEKGGMKPSTVRTTFNTVHTVRAVFRAAVSDRVIAASPCTDVDLPEVPRRKVVPLTVDQVRALAAAMPKRYRALITVGAGTVLRPGELFGLQVRHVDFFKRQRRVE
ncbi:site-specific integrase [Streptomyces qaidamensis]|uniref:site-specific integrase n=1 Tax=Streptomyces qaidamensis TaxID=1783515 RepID=UPI001F1F409E|nr:site-specific integrase [Streptomyces qaidamensis]